MPDACQSKEASGIMIGYVRPQSFSKKKEGIIEIRQIRTRLRHNHMFRGSPGYHLVRSGPMPDACKSKEASGIMIGYVRPRSFSEKKVVRNVCVFSAKVLRRVTGVVNERCDVHDRRRGRSQKDGTFRKSR